MLNVTASEDAGCSKIGSTESVSHKLEDVEVIIVNVPLADNYLGLTPFDSYKFFGCFYGYCCITTVRIGFNGFGKGFI